MTDPSETLSLSHTQFFFILEPVLGLSKFPECGGGGIVLRRADAVADFSTEIDPKERVGFLFFSQKRRNGRFVPRSFVANVLDPRSQMFVSRFDAHRELPVALRVFVSAIIIFVFIL